jgi:hypothetical protein
MKYVVVLMIAMVQGVLAGAGGGSNCRAGPVG